MKTLVCIAMPCLLWADPPLTLDEVLAKSKVSVAKLNVDTTLAEGLLQVKEASGFMRESPSVVVSTGPRTSVGGSSTSDQTIEIDVPLLLKRKPVSNLASQLNSATPILYTAADLENRLAIHQAFLDAWLAEQIESIRAEDHLQATTWLEIAKARHESGADSAFQLDLVKGELLKSRMDWEDAKRVRIQTWINLRLLSELPETPQQLDYHRNEEFSASSSNREELENRYRNGALHRASIAKQNMETSQINLQAAMSGSRWSLSGSYAKESDERITKIGVAYKFPRVGESSAIRAEQRARLETSKRNAEFSIAELDQRFAAALQTINSSENYPEAPDITTSLEALTLRLKEGKDQPSDVIPMRRQFLEIRIAELQRTHSLYLAQAELLTLTSGN